MPTPGATILGCAGPVLDRGEARALARLDPWGLILFARNVQNPGQLRRLTGDLRAALGRNAPIFIDQEGGRVARLRPPEWRGWPAPLDVLACLPGAAAERYLWLRYRLIAAELRDLGIDGNCAPLADIARPETHAILRDRCYGTSPAEVVPRTRAVAEACLSGGVLPVLKHIPGHGRATADSHLDLPRVTATRADLDTGDFAAFRALADLPLGMTAHIVYDALDAARPATLSATAIGAIRADMGFDGLLMTDDISMQALSGPLAARSAAAIGAGCDLVLHCNGQMAEMEEVADAAGGLSPAAAERAARALAARRAPEAADLPALAAECAALEARHG